MPDTTADLRRWLPRLDSNQQPFGKHSLSDLNRTEPRGQSECSGESAPNRAEPHPFSDAKLTCDLGSCAGSPDVAPTETYVRDGEEVARFGVFMPEAGEPRDPIPCVWTTGWRGGEIETSEMRLALAEAEAWAHRILAAVRYQRARNDEKRTTELNAMATAAAATHDWRPANSAARCTRCHCVVYGDEFLAAGVVPTCGTPCSQSWHEISTALSGEDGDAVCIFCRARWSATHLYVFQDASGRSLPWGPYLTFDQAIARGVDDQRFVPMKLARAEAHAAVAERKLAHPMDHDPFAGIPNADDSENVVPLDVALAPYRARTDARRAGQAVNW